MALRRSPATLGLLGLALVALVPALYLLQGVLRQFGVRAPEMLAEWNVQVNEQNPALLHLALEPVEEDDVWARPARVLPMPDGVWYRGQSTLQQAAFPWRSTPFQATVYLQLSQAALLDETPPIVLSTADRTLQVRYAERYLLGPEALPRPTPCEGTLTVREVGPTSADAPAAIDLLLNGEVDLDCREGGPGGQDPLARQRWRVRGSLRTRWRGREGR